MATTNNRTDKILVVDDDARIRDLLRRYLTQEGFEIMIAEDGKALNRILLRETVDLIVLDLMMPGEDGLSICRRLRCQRPHAHHHADRQGRGCGPHRGPGSGRRRLSGQALQPARTAGPHPCRAAPPPASAPGAPSGDNEVVTFGPFTFDLGTRVLQKNGEELPLTTGEFAMLKALVRHPRQPLSREKLALLARGREFEPFDRSLDVQVSRLRKLIEEDAAAPRYPDRLGRGLCVRTRWHELILPASIATSRRCAAVALGTGP
jgi:two-component system phosphate regulon response regulator OmpR